MLKDYRVSLTLLAVVMIGYTAMVLLSRPQTNDSRIPATQTALKASSHSSPGAVVEEASAAVRDSKAN